MTDARSPVDEAWAKCFLSDLPESAQREIRDSGHELEMMRGQVVFRELVQPRYSFFALVVSGVVRTFISSPGGRRLATRYALPGDVIGLTSVLLEGAAGGLDCVRAGVLLHMDPVTVRRLARTNPEVSWPLAVQMAREVSSVGGARIPNMFGSVRVRVAWHLTKLMTPAGDGVYLVRMTQQDLAESVGSVREVVARVLSQLRDEGVLTRDVRNITVADPKRLSEIAESIDS